MKLIFVGGPFRGDSAWDIEQNIRSAEELSLELWRRGVAVICPHTNTRFFQGAAPDKIWLQGYLEMLKRCDALMLVAGWEQSSGTRAEVKLAKELNIPVFERLYDFEDWMKTCES